MKKKRYSPEEIAFALREAKSGTPVAAIVSKLGVSEQTFYRWKRRYSNACSLEQRRIRELEEENNRLKQLVAELSLERQALQNILAKK